jgi:hypothetical protein
MPVQVADPFGSFLQGRQARQDEQYGQKRNALAQMELEQAPRDIANRNALADRQQEQYSQEQIARSLQQTAAAAMRIAQSANPKAELQANREFAANLMKQHPELAQMGDDDIKEYMGWIAGEAQSKLGIAPAQPKAREPFTLGAGQTRYGPDGQPIASAPVPNAMTPYQQERLSIEREKLNKPSAADTGPLVQVAGPDGNPVYATRESAVGKPAYVARDKPAAADLKYQREIKTKIPRLKAAERRLERLAEAAGSIEKNWLFDGGKLDQYALAWTKQGGEMEQSAASLVPELTALTRVPGIGSQSDLESRLASLQFPSAEFGPETNRKAVAELRAFIGDLKDAYGAVEGDFKSAEVQSLLDKYAPQ